MYSIRKKYRTLILDYPEFCLENNSKRDIIGQLWKNSFYKQIEEFRKAIKKCKVQYDADRNALPQLKNHIAQLQQDFDAFLVYSIQFFQKLVTEV